MGFSFVYAATRIINENSILLFRDNKMQMTRKTAKILQENPVILTYSNPNCERSEASGTQLRLPYTISKMGDDAAVTLFDVSFLKHYER